MTTKKAKEMHMQLQESRFMNSEVAFSLAYGIFIGLEDF
jgi:hypothetical protein